jgi:uridine kinase
MCKKGFALLRRQSVLVHDDQYHLCVAKVDVESLLQGKPARVGRAKLIGIDGHGGAGKSSLADLLAKKLQAEVLHTDDFASWDNPKNWWPLLIEQVLEPMAAGAASLSYPRSKWWEGHDREPIVDQPVTDAMILEGVSSLRSEFRRYLSLGVFIAVSREICLERGIARDAGMGTREKITKQWEKWFDDESGYIERDHPEEFADVIIDGTLPFEDQLLL